MDKRRSCFLWFPIRFTTYRIEKTMSGDLELISEKGIFMKRIDKLKLFKISDISYSRGFGNFICGVSNLVLYTSEKSSATQYVVKIRGAKEFMETLEVQVAKERKRVKVGYTETNII